MVLRNRAGLHHVSDMALHAPSVATILRPAVQVTHCVTGHIVCTAAIAQGCGETCPHISVPRDNGIQPAPEGDQ